MTNWELKDLQNLPVVSNDTAQRVGRVDDVLFDPARGALFGLVVRPEAKEAQRLLIPLGGIRSIGNDAITIESISDAAPFGDSEEAQEIAADDGHRYGMQVLTESGELIGQIDKVRVKEDGTVASYHSTTGMFGSKHDFDLSEVRSASKDIIVILDSAREGPVKNVAG